MALSLLSQHKQAFLFLVHAVSVLIVIASESTYAQTNSRQDACQNGQNLKPIKNVPGTYSEEASRKGIEGKVVLCVTVNAKGEVTGASPISGPSELIEPSLDAARKWQFEPPPKAPAVVKVEMGYNLSKPCPDGSNGSDVGEIKVDIGTGHLVEGEEGSPVKITGVLNRPQPPYPEIARAEWRRGQLYLSIVVNANGRVVDAKIVRSLDDVLDKPALETVRTWQFKVTSGGKTTVFPVTLSFQIPCLDHPKNGAPNR